MPERTLLKSWAIAPARRPIASSFWLWWTSSSSARRSVTSWKTTTAPIRAPSEVTGPALARRRIRFPSGRSKSISSVANRLSVGHGPGERELVGLEGPTVEMEPVETAVLVDRVRPEVCLAHDLRRPAVRDHQPARGDLGEDHAER